MIPSTAKRVERNTSQQVNRQIEADIRNSVRWHAARPERIESRLRQLDREWDVERVLEANAASLALFGVLLGATVDRRFRAVPAIVPAFLLQHAVQGWCPPVPILRRFGIRTAREIHKERSALKAIRGDFARVQGADDPVSAALQAAALS